MKKQFFTWAMAALSVFTTWGQLSPEDIYNRYSNEEGVLAMSLPKSMLEEMDLELDLDQHLQAMEGQVENLRLLIFSKEGDPSLQIRKIDAYLANEGLREIKMNGKQEDAELSFFRIYGSKVGESYSRLYVLLMSDDKNTALFAEMSGKIKITKEI